MSYTEMMSSLRILLLVLLASPVIAGTAPDFKETNKNNAYKIAVNPWNYSSFDESISYAIESDTSGTFQQVL